MHCEPTVFWAYRPVARMHKNLISVFVESGSATYFLYDLVPLLAINDTAQSTDTIALRVCSLFVAVVLLSHKPVAG